MATKRGKKRRIDDNERISKRNTEGSEAEKRVRISDDSVDGIYDMICIIFFIKEIIYSIMLNYILLLVNKKTIEKLLRVDSQIISKLEVLLTGQKNLETHFLGIEKKLNDDNKKNNTTNSDYIKVIKDENLEFLQQFKKNQWIIFFEKKICQIVS